MVLSENIIIFVMHYKSILPVESQSALSRYDYEHAFYVFVVLWYYGSTPVRKVNAPQYTWASAYGCNATGRWSRFFILAFKQSLSRLTIFLFIYIKSLKQPIFKQLLNIGLKELISQNQQLLHTNNVRIKPLVEFIDLWVNKNTI